MLRRSAVALLLGSLSLLGALSLFGCDDLAPPDPTFDAGIVEVDAGPDASPLPPNGPHVVHAYDVDGFVTRVDAIDYVQWVYLDLDTGAEVTESDAGWDLRIRRFDIALNGGATGAGGVEVAWIAGASLADTTAAPSEGFVTDTAEKLAFSDWYGYDEGAHILAPIAGVYVVRSGTGAYYAIAMAGYYNGAGTSGNPWFRWKAL